MTHLTDQSLNCVYLASACTCVLCFGLCLVLVFVCDTCIFIYRYFHTNIYVRKYSHTRTHAYDIVCVCACACVFDICMCKNLSYLPFLSSPNTHTLNTLTTSMVRLTTCLDVSSMFAHFRKSSFTVISSLMRWSNTILLRSCTYTYTYTHGVISHNWSSLMRWSHTICWEASHTARSILLRSCTQTNKQTQTRIGTFISICPSVHLFSFSLSLSPSLSLSRYKHINERAHIYIYIYIYIYI